MAYTPTDSTPDPLHPSITLTITQDGEVLSPYEKSSESSEEQSDSYEEIEILTNIEAELDPPKEEVLEITDVKRRLSAEIEIAKIEQLNLIAYNASISENRPPLEKEAAALVKKHTQFSGTPPIRSPNTQRRVFSMTRY